MAAKAPKAQDDSPLREVRLQARDLVLTKGYAPEDAIRILSPRFRRLYLAAGGNAACYGQPDKWVKDRRVLISLRQPDLYTAGAQGISLEDALEIDEVAVTVAQDAGDTAGVSEE